MADIDRNLLDKKYKEVNTILRKAEHGLNLVNDARDLVGQLETAKELNDNMKNLLKNSFVNVRNVTLDFCGDVEKFDFNELFKLNIDKNKINGWIGERNEILKACEFYREESVVKDFTDKLDELANVFKSGSEDEKLLHISVVDYYFSEAGNIFEKGAYLFGKVLRELKQLMD